jgi:hypothetical protein
MMAELKAEDDGCMEGVDEGCDSGDVSKSIFKIIRNDGCNYTLKKKTTIILQFITKIIMFHS